MVEGAVLLAEAGEALGDLVLLALRLRGDGHGVARGVANSMPGAASTAFASQRVSAVLVSESLLTAPMSPQQSSWTSTFFLPLHIVDVAELLLGAAAGVREGHVGRDLAGDDLEEAELAELVAEGLVDDWRGRGRSH